MQKGVVSAALLRKHGLSDEYIIQDYLATYENVKELLNLFVQEHPEVDAEIIMPKAEYMKKFLELYG